MDEQRRAPPRPAGQAGGRLARALPPAPRPRSDDQCADAGGGGGPTGPCRLGGPAPGDELAVPAQDRGRRDDQVHAAPGWEETGESGDQGAVGPARPRTRDASAKDGELMAKDQDLDLFGAVRSNPQHHHAQKFGQHQVDQPQRHRSIMPGFRRRQTSRSGEVSRLSGTHRRKYAGCGQSATPWDIAGLESRRRSFNQQSPREEVWAIPALLDRGAAARRMHERATLRAHRPR
jgi:hypothetical protein